MHSYPGSAHLVRPLRAEDLDDAVELLSGTSASDTRHVLRSDLTVGTPFAVVAERDGRLVGVAKLSDDLVFPGTVGALLAVNEAARGQGIGTVLANALEAEMGQRGSGTATCAIRDDMPRGRTFAEKHGFGVVHHSVGFRFELGGREAELTERAKAALARADVRVRVATMAADEEAIADCFERCRLGLPLPFGDRPVDMRARLREFPPNTVFLLAEPLTASDDELAAVGSVRPRGMTILIPDSRENSWYVRFTGTDPDHRGRGVAAAVKAVSLLHAGRAGVDAVTTHNDESNSPIIRANEALGMRPDVGYWSLSRDLSY